MRDAAGPTSERRAPRIVSSKLAASVNTQVQGLEFFLSERLIDRLDPGVPVY